MAVSSESEDETTARGKYFYLVGFTGRAVYASADKQSSEDGIRMYYRCDELLTVFSIGDCLHEEFSVLEAFCCV